MSRRARRWLLALLFLLSLWLTPHALGQSAPFESPPTENRLYMPLIGGSGSGVPASIPISRGRSVPPLLILTFFFVLIIAAVLTTRRRR